MTLIEFLTTRLDEHDAWLDDWTRSHDGEQHGGGFLRSHVRSARTIVETAAQLDEIVAVEDPLGMGDGTQAMTIEWVMRKMALPYVDHPDYRLEWESE